jgi:hypothetical protein
MAGLWVHLQPSIGDRRRAPLLFLTRQEVVLLPPQDQRRHVDLTEPGRVIDCKHHPLIVVAPDAGRNLEALGDRLREELFRDRVVDHAQHELPDELRRDGIFQRKYFLP